jgi:hypothetical protein
MASMKYDYWFQLAFIREKTLTSKVTAFYRGDIAMQGVATIVTVTQYLLKNKTGVKFND